LTHNVASIDPNFDTDRTERRSRFGKSIIDIRAQSVKRQSTVQIPFRSRDFSAVQSSRHPDFDALTAKPLGVLHRLAPRAAKRDSLFKLQRNLFGLQLGIQLWLVNLLDVDQDFTTGLSFDLVAELVDLCALSTDDDSRSRGVNDDLQLVGSALDI